MTFKTSEGDVTDHDPAGPQFVVAIVDAVNVEPSCALDEGQDCRTVVTFYESGGSGDLDDTDVPTHPTAAAAAAEIMPDHSEPWTVYQLVPVTLDGGPEHATMDDGTELRRRTAGSLRITGNGPAPESTRYFLGVTDAGLRVGTAITARWAGEQRAIPMTALHGDMTGVGVFEELLTAQGSPLLWPVSEAVYDAFFADEQDDEDDLRNVEGDVEDAHGFEDVDDEQAAESRS